MEISKSWKIEADSCNVILLQRKVSEPSDKFPDGNETWKQTYHPDVKAALQCLIRKEINATGLENLETISDCLDNLYNIVSKIPVVVIEKIVSKKEGKGVVDEDVD